MFLKIICCGKSYYRQRYNNISVNKTFSKLPMEIEMKDSGICVLNVYFDSFLRQHKYTRRNETTLPI